jgi:uncharacterized protein YxeA
MKKILILIAFILCWVYYTFYNSKEIIQIYTAEENNYLVSIHQDNSIITTKYIDHFKENLYKKYNNHWVEIQNFFVANKKIRFAHIFSFKTFVCGKGTLIMNINWEEKEIFSFDKEKLEIEPCTFNVTQTKTENIFLVDFCLSSWWGSGECLWIDMYYNINTNNWSEGKLFFTWYSDNKMVKLPVDKNSRNWKYFKKDYDEVIKYMNR